MHFIPFSIGIVLGGLAVYLYMHKAMITKAETEISAEISKLRADYAAARAKVVADADAVKVEPGPLSTKLTETANRAP